jgi:hypothetical protein
VCGFVFYVVFLLTCWQVLEQLLRAQLALAHTQVAISRHCSMLSTMSTCVPAEVVTEAGDGADAASGQQHTWTIHSYTLPTFCA